MSIKKITILDYGVGNLFNVSKAFVRLGYDVQMTSSQNHIKDSEFLVIPGVGAFTEGMKGLLHFGLLESLKKYIQSGKPVLGFCLGMQLLFDASEEHQMTDGLKIIEGNVTKLSDPTLKVPHIGWAKVIASKDQNNPLIAEKNEPYFYFVHSYVCNPKDKTIVMGSTQYGNENFVSLIRKNNIWGCQFHPERSGPVGMRLIQNIIGQSNG